jgi:hypothetical protein
MGGAMSNDNLTAESIAMTLVLLDEKAKYEREEIDITLRHPYEEAAIVIRQQEQDRVVLNERGSRMYSRIEELEQQLRESNQRGMAATARVIELERASSETNEQHEPRTSRRYYAKDAGLWITVTTSIKMADNEITISDDAHNSWAQSETEDTRDGVRTHSFWSPDRRLLMTVFVTDQDIQVSDDNGDVYEAAGNEQVFSDSPTKSKVKRCAATIKTDPPQDCDAPFCGCNPAWAQCIEWLQEMGWKSPDELRLSQPTEAPHCPTCSCAPGAWGDASIPSALRAAAQAVVERWDTPLWKDAPATATYINALRKALKGAPEPPEEPRRDSNFILMQCEEGLRIDHDCPATFALAAILAELTPETSTNTLGDEP